jgi:hypothetical protein
MIHIEMYMDLQGPRGPWARAVTHSPIVGIYEWNARTVGEAKSIVYNLCHAFQFDNRDRNSMLDVLQAAKTEYVGTEHSLRRRDTEDYTKFGIAIEGQEAKPKKDVPNRDLNEHGEVWTLLTFDKLTGQLVDMEHFNERPRRDPHQPMNEDYSYILRVGNVNGGDSIEVDF